MGLKMHELKSRQTPWTDNYGTKKRKCVKLFFRNELAIPRHDKHFKLLSFLHFVWSFLFSFPCCELSQNLCSTDDNAIAHYENNRAHKTKKRDLMLSSRCCWIFAYKVLLRTTLQNSFRPVQNELSIREIVTHHSFFSHLLLQERNHRVTMITFKYRLTSWFSHLFIG